MTEQRLKRPNVGGDVTPETWADFLEARTKEELEAANTLGPHGWWELTEPGARRFDVQGLGGRVFAPILTGSGHFLDQAAAMHIVRNQPQRTSDDLLVKLMLANLLKEKAQLNDSVVSALLMLVQQFCAPFIDHPDHPEYVPQEEP
ncbi:DUF6221 family protein [Streptomyces sp. NPDC049915]|uniref:DUF6221 family protein n=1 Tax=Streptomyces sp. NPDC049915 TaxID=3155510 RepID=UPI003441B8BD